MKTFNEFIKTAEHRECLAEGRRRTAAALSSVLSEMSIKSGLDDSITRQIANNADEYLVDDGDVGAHAFAAAMAAMALCLDTVAGIYVTRNWKSWVKEKPNLVVVK